MMEQKTLEKLEFEEIRKGLINFCSHPLSIKWGAELPLAKSFEETEDRLFETSCALELYGKYPLLPDGALPKMDTTLEKISKGSAFNGLDAYACYKILVKTKEIKRFFTKGIEVGVFSYLLKILEENNFLENKLANISDQDGQIKDEASSLLRAIRQKIIAKRGKLKDTIESLTKKGPYVSFLQEPVVIKRGESYCLSVKKEYGGKIGGIVQDVSGSGSTLFIEPKEGVAIRSELSFLYREETEEIERILKEVTELCFESKDLLLNNYQVLGKYDFFLGKAKLVRSFKGIVPLINTRGFIKIIEGRHPLLRGEVVANTVIVGEDFKTLVVTGPNTGGKTVLLKMVGLFSLMVRLGLGLPVLEGSEISFFKNVLADIGDEQSISQSLSTFSSHMVQLKEMLDVADEETLLLFDELGGGTDPREGSSLARAILWELTRRKATTILTTHYGELKVFAYETEGVENASVTFNPETFAPTYKLIIGTPGASLGITIAERYGLDQNIIKKAQSYLKEEEKDVSGLLLDLETKRAVYQEKNQELENELLKISSEKAKLKEEMEKFALKKELKEKKVQEKRDAYLSTLRIEVEEIIKELKKEYKGNMEAGNIARKKIDALKNRENRLVVQIEEKEGVKDLLGGESVFVSSLQKEGIVESVDKGKKQAIVKIGIMKINLPFKDLTLKREQKSLKSEQVVKKVYEGQRKQVPLELLLLGKNLDEAISLVDKYLDEAYLASYPFVRVIHGRGTGVLKNGLWEYFSTHPLIKSFRLGEKGEGSDGATVVYLK